MKWVTCFVLATTLVIYTAWFLSLREDEHQSDTAVDHRAHYRIVVAVLASHRTAAERAQRRVWVGRWVRTPGVRVLLFYGCRAPYPSFECNERREGQRNMDVTLPHVVDMDDRQRVRKWIAAFRYIEDHYRCDFVVRSPFGAVWMFPQLAQEVWRALPWRYVAGVGLGATTPSYMRLLPTSGWILSYDVVRSALDHAELLDYHDNAHVSLLRFWVSKDVVPRVLNHSAVLVPCEGAESDWNAATATAVVQRATAAGASHIACEEIGKVMSETMLSTLVEAIYGTSLDAEKCHDSITVSCSSGALM